MAKIDLRKKVWKTVESQGKVSEKSGNFENDIEWQPCIGLYARIVVYRFSNVT